jgi:hypothetical protein
VLENRPGHGIADERPLLILGNLPEKLYFRGRE